jgi:ABC-type phosphate/phosphonate transport system substrate-binding protein/outer membrane protein assembly factor BamB
MNDSTKQLLGFLIILVLSSLIIFSIANKTTNSSLNKAEGYSEELHIVVMDPLSARLACACVEGFAQRDYDELANFLSKQLNRKIDLSYGENLAELARINSTPIDIVIGKESLVLYDAKKAGIDLRPIARLTGQDGNTTLQGLFIVRADDPAKSIEDLKEHRILFGPFYETEKSQAAVKALNKAQIPLPVQLEASPSCNTAALAVFENDADAAVISSYALALLEGCDTIDKGVIRVIGKTEPVPFITVFASDSVTQKDEEKVLQSLIKASENKELLKKMESKAGFISIKKNSKKQDDLNGQITPWPDFRGINRDAISSYIPEKLPQKANFLWRRQLSGLSLAGIAADDKYIIVADKDKEYQFDIFRCLDAYTGSEVWQVKYEAAGEMDYSNTPRANPVIHNGLAYLLGAFGHLHCVELATGRIRWKMNIVEDFNAELISWGVSATPLIVDDKIIVNPGAKDASIVALDKLTGKVIWKTPGQPAAYSSLIIDTFGGVRQIVGYDAISIGGWDPKTGKRLWTLLPKYEGDFNVPIPINVDGKLLLMTENNGTRLYDFDDEGAIIQEPIAANEALASDCSSAVELDGLVYGCSGGLVCLDTNNDLHTTWIGDDDAFYDFANLIAGNGHVLIVSIEGELVLIEASKDECRIISRLELFERAEIWSHPALIENRLYLRTQDQICCVLLDG